MKLIHHLSKQKFQKVLQEQIQFKQHKLLHRYNQYNGKGSGSWFRFWRIFCHWIREYDPTSLYGIKLMKNENRRYKYIKMRKTQCRPVKDVRTKHRITELTQVESTELYKVWYPLFTVKREDGKIWYFTEADFPNLELPDLEFIRTDLRTRTIRPLPYVAALEAVVRYMKRALVLSYVEDLQMGIENQY